MLKVMHISTANISNIGTDTDNNTIDIKYDNAYELLISIFRFDLGLF